MRGTSSFCEKCGEQVCIVSLGGKFFTRPLRFSRCKFYKPPGLGGKGASKTCHTELFETANGAREAFSKLFKADDSPVEAKERANGTIDVTLKYAGRGTPTPIDAGTSTEEGE